MKNKKLVIVIIIISIILVLGISVAITAPIIIKQYKNNMKQTDNKRNNDEKEVKKTNNTLSEEQIEKILTGLETKPACSKVNPCGKMDYDYFKDKTIKVSDLSQEMVGYVILNHLIKDGLQLKEGETFTKEQVQEEVKKTFGDYKYEDHSIVSCPSIDYDENGTYKVGSSNCGCSCTTVGAHKKMVDYETSDNDLIIYVRVLFEDDLFKYYKDYNKTEEVTDESDYEQGTLYKLTFQKEDGNFVFKSSEPQE